jgi:ADP-ribose pyrophosphatase YjhB (NUDIX family)
MNFEPQNLFIGLIDFFSVLMPGAILTYLMKSFLGSRFLGNEYGGISGTEGWVVFLFSSYLLGHFIFLVGSRLDKLYDAIRKATYQEQIKRLAKGKALSLKTYRWLAQCFFKKDADRAVDQAVRIKEYYLDPLNASSAINTFQWCKARLILEHPEAMATIQRFEADSKFFRSLLVVLCILFPCGLVTSRPEIVFVSVPLIALAFWRYVDQRAKATNQAYWYIITLEGSIDGALRKQSQSQTNGITHAGGVVFRRMGDQVEYLLVRATIAPEEWVLPKGHIESCEQMLETAVREVYEETGVWARITDEWSSISFSIKGERVKTQFYLMEAIKEEKPTDKREHAWLILAKALSRASHEESQELLKFAEQKRAARIINSMEG